jgi:acetyl esterase/lipase
MNFKQAIYTYILVCFSFHSSYSYADFFQNLNLLQWQNTTMNIPYGTHSLQKLDLYLPTPKAKQTLNQRFAPILVIVHGGAWRIGDKSHNRVVQNKAAYWNTQGWLVISVNYRLVPEVSVQQQTQDIADALRFVQSHAASWQADPQHIVIMGHSAGAHLVTLLSTQPAWIIRYPQPWKATIALDSAAYDLEKLMSGQHATIYDPVFGTSVDYSHAVSPQHQIRQALPAFLAVCSTLRPDQPCNQAQAFTEKAKALGTTTQLLPISMTHTKINRNLGLNNSYTQQVHQFIQQQLQ